MVILALDASTKNSGYAIFKDKELIKYGCIQSSKTNVIERILIMIKEIDNLITEYQIDKVILEEVLPKNEAYDDGANHHANPKVFKPLMWLQGGIALMIYVNHNQKQEKEIEIEYILPNSWRSKVGIRTGRGIKRENLKIADIKFAKDTFGIDVNDDVADACGIGWAYIKDSQKQVFNWQ